MTYFSAEKRIRELSDIDLSRQSYEEARSNLHEALCIIPVNFEVRSTNAEEEEAMKKIGARLVAYKSIILGYQKLIDVFPNIVEVPSDIKEILDEYQIVDPNSKKTNLANAKDLFELIRELYHERDKEIVSSPETSDLENISGLDFTN